MQYLVDYLRRQNKPARFILLENVASIANEGPLAQLKAKLARANYVLIDFAILDPEASCASCLPFACPSLHSLYDWTSKVQTIRDYWCSIFIGCPCAGARAVQLA